MLSFVRNQQKSFIIKIAFAIIILSFIIGYAMLTSPGGPGDDGQTDIAATVNDINITFTDFQAAYGNLYQTYQNIYKEQFTPEMEKQLKLVDNTINGLIDRVLLLEDANDKVLAFMRAGLVFVFNFHASCSHSDYLIEAPPGRYEMIMDSDALEYGGHQRLLKGQNHLTLRKRIRGNQRNLLSLYLPTRTAIVLSRISIR